MSSPDNVARFPDLAEVIARAERRRATLERLAEIGLELAEEIKNRSIHAPLDPKPRHDPSEGLTAVARAVRLTVALEARFDADITAMRNGEWTPAGREPASAVAAVAPLSATSQSPSRKAREGISRDIGDMETVRGPHDRLH
jgi:hypothetical protein